MHKVMQVASHSEPRPSSSALALRVVVGSGSVALLLGTCAAVAWILLRRAPRRGPQAYAKVALDTADDSHEGGERDGDGDVDAIVDAWVDATDVHAFRVVDSVPKQDSGRPAFEVLMKKITTTSSSTTDETVGQRIVWM